MYTLMNLAFWPFYYALLQTELKYETANEKNTAEWRSNCPFHDESREKIQMQMMWILLMLNVDIHLPAYFVLSSFLNISESNSEAR